MISQRAMTMFAEWMTHIPILLVLWTVRSQPLALCVGIVLLWLSVEAHERAQLNFYRSDAALNERDDKVEHEKFFWVADGFRTTSRCLRALAIMLPLIAWWFR